MGKIATFKAKYLKDDHLFLPKWVASTLFLRRGEELRVMIEKEEFDKQGFLNLFSIWKGKSEEEINIYREIVKEREMFGRGEIKL